MAPGSCRAGGVASLAASSHAKRQVIIFEEVPAPPRGSFGEARMGGHVPSAWARGSPAARKPPPQAQGPRARAAPPCLSLEKRARVKAPVQELVPNGGRGETAGGGAGGEQGSPCGGGARRAPRTAASSRNVSRDALSPVRRAAPAVPTPHCPRLRPGSASPEGPRRWAQGGREAVPPFPWRSALRGSRTDCGAHGAACGV